jgi:hypothetical protein
VPQVDSYCSEVTLAQIIDVYYELNGNDDVHDPEPIHLSLRHQPKFFSRLSSLLSAAQEGTGLSVYLERLYGNFRDDETGDGGVSEADDGHGSDADDAVAAERSPPPGTEFEHGVVGGENDLEGNESESAQEDVANGDVEKDATAQITAHKVEPSHDTVPAEGNALLAAVENQAQPPTNREVQDEIDFSDDDDLQANVATSRSSTVLSEHGTNGTCSLCCFGWNHSLIPLLESNEGHATENSAPIVAESKTSSPKKSPPMTSAELDAYLTDFDVKTNDEPEPALDATVLVPPSEEALSPGKQAEDGAKTNAAPVATADDELLFDYSDDDEDDEFSVKATISITQSLGTGTNGVERVDEATAAAKSPVADVQNLDTQDEIDFDDDEFDVPPAQAGPSSSRSTDSPLGKRTFDEHVGGTVAAEADQGKLADPLSMAH